MKICYIIINKNDYKSTKHLVDNIIDYKIIDNILIMDNASNKEERKKLTSIKNKKIEYLYNSVDKGYSSAINRACDHLIDKYGECIFIISNADVVIMDESDIEKLIEDLSFECVGVVGPEILERGKIIKGRKIPTPKEDILKNLGLSKTVKDDNTILNGETSSVEVISSAFFLMTSKTYKLIDKFDDNVFLYYEDNILASKLKKLKLYSIIDNRVKVKHNFDSTIEKEINMKKRFKLLMDAQIYFHKTYSNETERELKLLRLSNKIKLLKTKVKHKNK